MLELIVDRAVAERAEHDSESTDGSKDDACGDPLGSLLGGELGNGQPEDDEVQSTAQPSEPGALVGQVVTGTATAGGPDRGAVLSGAQVAVDATTFPAATASTSAW